MVRSKQRKVWHLFPVKKAGWSFLYTTLASLTVTPLGAMDMPSYGDALAMPLQGGVSKIADSGSSEVEMGKRFGKFMEGFSQQMSAPRENANPGRVQSDLPPVGQEYRRDWRDYGRDQRDDTTRDQGGRYAPDRRYDNAGDSRDYRYQDQRDTRYQDQRDYRDSPRDEQRTRDYYRENPYRYDPWGARYWGYQSYGNDPWDGYTPGELGIIGGRYPYEGGYDGYRGYGGYGSEYGYAPRQGYRPPPPYAPDDYEIYDPAYGGERRLPGRDRGYRDRSYNMSFDNPWDSFWPRRWPFSDRSWDW